MHVNTDSFKRGAIGVMATGSTLRSERYARLLREHAAGVRVVAQACTGLALAIERGDAAHINALVDEHTRPLRQAEVDVVVLGCTHYPFVRHLIERAMGPQTLVLDTAEAVARRAASLLSGGPGQGQVPAPTGGLSTGTLQWSSTVPSPSSELQALTQARFWTSGPPAALQDFAARWLGWAIKPQLLESA